MTTRVTVIGHADLAKKLDKLKNQADDEKTAAVKLVAELIRQAIADRAPRRTGALADNIIAVESDDNTAAGGTFVMDIGPARNPAFYAHFIEFGTGPGQTRPFIRPGYDENIDKAIETAAGSVKKGML